MTLSICMLKNIFSRILECKHVTLAINMLESLFPWHTKTRDSRLMYLSVLLEMS